MNPRPRKKVDEMLATLSTLGILRCAQNDRLKKITLAADYSKYVAVVSSVSKIFTVFTKTRPSVCCFMRALVSS